jgi:hypothetical protein
VPATLKGLFNLTGFLTQRDRWAGSFEELLLDAPRDVSDTPQHLPDAPKPAAPWTPPPNDTAVSVTSGEVQPQPQHCSVLEQECKGPDHTTAKQRRAIELFSEVCEPWWNDGNL